MPFGPNGEHVTIRLVDATQPANNRLTVCNQWTYQAGTVEKRFDRKRRKLSQEDMISFGFSARHW